MTPRELLDEIFRAAVQAADPNAATAPAVASLALERRAHIIALGKAARGMAAGALAALRDAGTEVAGGVVVTIDGEERTLEPLTVVVGDHPQPGDRSLRAARLLGAYVQRVAAGDHVIVLLSGGTSSLVAAPIAEVSDDSLRQLFASVLAAGAPIQAMNAIRRRVSRWGAGRLATALAHARVDLLVVSDVLGDDLPSIGSGPCSGDPTTARDVVDVMGAVGLDAQVLPDVVHYLREVAAGRRPETIKPGEHAVARVRAGIVLSNRHALVGAEARARALGVRDVHVIPDPLTSTSESAGALVVRGLLEVGAQLGHWESSCTIYGGETTVALGSEERGHGGRCLELALVAARELGRVPRAPFRLALLAAGTDGRDGPTDAAGAIVDSFTWRAITEAGRDPARDLARHDAYSALDAANALLRTGPTGTNVNDVVVGLVMR